MTTDTYEQWVRRRVAEAADAAPTPFSSALVATAAAAHLRDAAGRVAVEAARGARGAGVSWDECYEALFSAAVPDSTLSGAESAFYYCATGRPWPPAPGHTDPVMVLWTCQGCLHRVADTGPWEGPHAQSGHAPDCPRHDAEVIAWERLGEDVADGEDVEDEQ